MNEIQFLIILLIAIFIWIAIDSILWRRTLKTDKKSNDLKDLPSLVEMIKQQSALSPIARFPQKTTNYEICQKCGGTGELIYGNDGTKYDFPLICDYCKGEGKILI